MSTENKKPLIAAGEEILERCPLCQARFQEPVATNVKHECPACGQSFNVMTYSN